MAIFQIINESTPQVPKVKQSLNEKKWIQIGLEYRKAKAKGMTGKQFAEERGIKYSTFTSAMSKYASGIKTAEKIVDNRPHIPSIDGSFAETPFSSLK